jgi:hypothetical protein
VSGPPTRPGGLPSGSAGPLMWPIGPSFGWCLLEPSRVVFHSFRGLNYMLSSVLLFGVYDSGPEPVF